MKMSSKIVVFSSLIPVVLGVAISFVWFSADEALNTKYNELIENQAVASGVSVAQQVAATRSVDSQLL